VRAVVSALLALGCGGGPGPRPDAGPSPPPPQDALQNGHDAAPVAPPLDGPAVDSAPPPPIDAAPDSAPSPFPLDKVMMAKPELHAAIGGHIEGPSWRQGEVFFAAVGKGLVRIGADRKLYRYLPQLQPLGTYLLGDGSLLVCDARHTLVQVLRDGKVGVLGTGGVCNDVTVDADGNIYFSDFQGSVYRLTPEGQQAKALSLNKPNGLDVDPAGKYLYILPRPSDIYRVAITRDGPMGTPQKVGQLDGVTDGCAFDEWGNLWASVYYGGKIAIFDTTKLQVIASIGAGGGGLTNLTFGGPGRDEVFTTVDDHGVYRIPVGARGFAGHPGAAKYTIKSYLDMTPVNDPL
jgi:gluconolactonase